MSITMKDIARELGVSVATVSRALKNSPRISAEQRERINKFAREHDFVPNIIAESLRNSRTKPQKIIGVIIPQFAHFYFSSILSGIEQEASSRGYNILVSQSGERYDREVRICRSFYENKVSIQCFLIRTGLKMNLAVPKMLSGICYPKEHR